MSRTDAILARLPHLYRDGPELRRLADVIALQIQALDERGNLVRRTHHFDLAYAIEDAERLAAILDIEAEPWQERLGEYRAWVHGLRDAQLQAGSVTREAISIFVRRYLDGFQRARGVRLVPPVRELGEEPGDAEAALVENPPRLRYVAAPTGELLPLDRFTLENRGLDPVPLDTVITALGEDGPEYAPLLANLTTGRALVFLDTLPPGRRLWVEAVADGDDFVARARLEGHDVTDRLRLIDAFEPGRAESVVADEGSQRPIVLDRGPNEFWYLPLAHYDVAGLDRVLLALAELSLEQGRWGRSAFDEALFVQAAASTLQFAWREVRPATIRLSLPAGTMSSEPGAIDDALQARSQLGDALAEALERLAAAGVASEVDLRARREVQPGLDRLAAVFPKTIHERGPTGGDRLPDADGRFGVTDLDGSTYG